ncbi:MAG TPA: VOC family protein [Rhizomicrobium sp.]|jgi:catechol 2,3-dioxygenase-like lactoylglutathione lyase family enzyme
MSQQPAEAATVEAPVRAEGFNHLHLNVRDLARSVRFYKGAFGLKVSFKVGDELLFMTPEAAQHSLALHLVGPDEPVGMAGGFQHFGFKLDARDHDRAIAQVEKAGGKLVSRGKRDGQYPYAYVSDPDGYVIEL